MPTKNACVGVGKPFSDRGIIMGKVVVLGAGLGGLPAAYELRHFLSSDHEVVVVSNQEKFTFIPGLIQVAFGQQDLGKIQLDLQETLPPKGIQFVAEGVTQVDPHKQVVHTQNQAIAYDHLVVATGATLAFDQIPGMGPHGGHTQSVCTPDHALQAWERWQDFLENPGDLVVGAAPGAGCFGPAYEFLLMAEEILRKRGLRDRCRLIYLTPEPHVGHLGVADVTHSESLTRDLFAERGIEAVVNAEITQVSETHVHLKDGQTFPYKYAMILPSFRGATFLQNSPIADAKGFIPITDTFHHPEYPNIHGVGIAVALGNPIPTTVPIGLPKSGAMTEAMAAAVAHNIAVDLGCLAGPKQVPTLESVCLAEYGDTGIAYVAIPVLPDRTGNRPRHAYALRGAWVNWGKVALEHYFMLKMKWGWGLPWFERLGLRLLFQVQVTKNVPPEFRHHLPSV